MLLGLLASSFAVAHDFWIEARPYYTAPGDTVEFSLHVGEEFVGDSLPNIAQRYLAFSIYQPDRVIEMPGELGRDPAGYFQAPVEGTYLAGYQSIFNTTGIDSDTFVRYLEKEGLEHARKQFLNRDQKPASTTERFKRHAKVLWQTGQSFERDDSQLVIGYDLELVPRQNPYQLAPGSKLDLRLLYLGQPAADIMVAAFSKSAPDQVQTVRSDAQGRVSFVLDRPGPWLIKAVRIERLQDQQQEWESHWASLTFSLGR